MIDEFDRPLAHARLAVVSPMRTEVAYADGDGRFEVRLPVNGTWPLTVSDTGFEAITLRVSGSAGGEPIRFKLKRDATAAVPDPDRMSRGCRCGGDVFTHEGR